MKNRHWWRRRNPLVDVNRRLVAVKLVKCLLADHLHRLELLEKVLKAGKTIL